MYRDDDTRIGGPRHHEIRLILRFLGPLILAIGGIFAAVGLISFFSAFGSHGRPQHFWCAFVGLPLLALGSFLCKMGFMGAFGRYVAAEAAPVAKDTFNYLAGGTSEGVSKLAQAVGEGLAGAAGAGAGSHRVFRCPACNESTDADARFCKECGTALAKACRGCGERNDPDARFCDNCGDTLA